MSTPFVVKFPSHEAAIATVQSLQEMKVAIADMSIRVDRPVLVVIGGASKTSAVDYELIKHLFVEVLAPIAQKWQAAIVDGGTDTGVMQLMGRARQQIQGTFPLIGISPVGLVTLPGQEIDSEHAAPLEPHHSHFLLVPGSNWGDESSWLAAAASEIAQAAPSVTVLLNGGEITWEDASQNVTVQQRPLIVISGSGRAADLITAGLQGEPTDDRAIPLIESGRVQAIALTDLHRLGKTIEAMFASNPVDAG